MKPSRFILLLTLAVAPGISAAAEPQTAPSKPAQSHRALRQLGMVDIPGSPGFDQMAIANGKLLLVHTAASSLDIVDPARRRVVAQVVNLQSPRGIAVDQQNRKIYVAQADNNSIAVISFDGWQVTNIIPVSQRPTSLLLDDNGNRLYWASASNNSLSVLDVNTRENIGTVVLGGRPCDMTWNADRQVAFVTLQDARQVVAVDPKLH